MGSRCCCGGIRGRASGSGDEPVRSTVSSSVEDWKGAIVVCEENDNQNVGLICVAAQEGRATRGVTCRYLRLATVKHDEELDASALRGKKRYHVCARTHSSNRRCTPQSASHLDCPIVTRGRVDHSFGKALRTLHLPLQHASTFGLSARWFPPTNLLRIWPSFPTCEFS
jgi:hypothetical protein